MAGKLTTHVLDTASGRPAAGVKLRLYQEKRLVMEAVTNAGGRTDAPFLDEAALIRGSYRIEFEVGGYFAAIQHANARHFWDVVPVVFIVDPARGYHVPLLVSPWAYSPYRGS